MKEQELNRKLAKWVGWTIDGDEVIILHTEYPPDQTCRGYEVEYLCKVDQLNFTQSLDACFKWLVPKCCNWDYDDNMLVLKGQSPSKEPDEDGDYGEWWLSEVEGINGHFVGEAETPALALCLAIERLIDS